MKQKEECFIKSLSRKRKRKTLRIPLNLQRIKALEDQGLPIDVSHGFEKEFIDSIEWKLTFSKCCQRGTVRLNKIKYIPELKSLHKFPIFKKILGFITTFLHLQITLPHLRKIY